MRVVVMGVAGCGKSTVARALAAQLNARFIEADEFHLPSSIDKMSTGVALDDHDRWPWLIALRNELRTETYVVLACSALKVEYRDLLRSSGDVRFLFLDLAPETALERINQRTEHFMGAAMVDSQFAALQRPIQLETDVATLIVDSLTPDQIEAEALALLSTVQAGRTVKPVLADGDVDRTISSVELRAHIDLLSGQIIEGGARRVLLVPPDHTRLHSMAGVITAGLFTNLTSAGCDVAVLPALGTHVEMSADDALLLFGPAVPFEAILHHRWRDQLVRLGEIGAAEVTAVSNGRYNEAIPVEVDEILLDSWDLVVSVGQVVPHEVIGMANFTKNIVIGLGGAPTIHRSHFLGAVCDMESIMGRTDSPVRHVIDAAFDRFIAPHVNVMWILTVMQDTEHGVVQRGLFVGGGRSTETGGAAFRSAADLARRCNVETIPGEYDRVACWLDPNEFRSTWLGNKAIYRTRMAIADGGELIVLAPGIATFGEDPSVDALIRRFGYRGTRATLDAISQDPELAASLGAAAHLVHGSTEGRFEVVYCTDPEQGGLSADEVRSVGFSWRPLRQELIRLGVTASTPAGPRTDADGRTFQFIANPALGLWAAANRFASNNP